MISKKQYIKAKKIVELYEQQIENIDIIKARQKFPLNCFLKSKLNNKVRGQVIGYRIYNGTIQLLLKRDKAKNTTVLIHNAIRY